METTESPELIDKQNRRRWMGVGLIALTLLFAALVGHMVSGANFVRAAVQTDATTETLTESEREELNRLRTAVAQATACASATPTTETESMASPVAVEPMPAGTTVDTVGNWTVTVKGISIPAVEIDATPTGRFLQVEFTVKNNESSSRSFGFGNWVLVDDQGREYELHHRATINVSGTFYYRGIGAGAEKTFFIVYDVAGDAGSNFTLIYRTDPTIQYALTLQTFG